MTAHVHDHDNPDSADPVGRRHTRPRWLLPALIVAIGAGTLVLAGILPLSTVLYAGLFGGMILMHLGGHGGHGGHGSHGGQGGAGSGDGSAGSSDARPDAGPDGEAQGQHQSRGCH